MSRPPQVLDVLVSEDQLVDEDRADIAREFLEVDWCYLDVPCRSGVIA